MAEIRYEMMSNSELKIKLIEMENEYESIKNKINNLVMRMNELDDSYDKVKQILKTGVKATDFKSELQELTQANKQKLSYTAETYLTKGGQENFKANVFIDKIFISYGTGSTKREAEQNAAKKALAKIKK